MIRGRKYSLIELIRIILLLLLICFHWSHFWEVKYLDTKIIKSIGNLSVFGFAVITGAFAMNGKKLIFKNIWRIIFIIIISSILTPIVFAILHKNIESYLSSMLTGSRDSWYLYSILPTYVFAQFFGLTLNKYKNFYIFIIGFMICLICFAEMNISLLSILLEQYMAGMIKSSWFLFGSALMGNALFKMIIKWEEKYKKYILNIIFLSLMVVFLLANTIIVWKMGSKASSSSSPLIWALFFSIFSLVIINNFESIYILIKL